MSEENSKKIRSRSERLNPAMVKAFAKTKRLTSFKQFELAMIKFLNVAKDQVNTTAAKAWGGEEMDRNRAKKVAEFFGLGQDYSQLQTPPDPQWVKLLQQYCVEERFFKLMSSKNKLDLIDYGFNKEDGLTQIPLKTQWRIELSGQPDEQVFMLLRSSGQFYLLAPLNVAADFNNTFDSETLIYPQRQIKFNQNDGIGWREFIAIKAKAIPFAPRHPDEGFSLELNELERFAHQLLEDNESVEVARYAFMLVP